MILLGAAFADIAPALIGLAGVLVGATLSGFVAWVVARSSLREDRRREVMASRQAAYGDVLVAFEGLARGMHDENAAIVDSHLAKAQLAAMTAGLVAPEPVRDAIERAGATAVTLMRQDSGGLDFDPELYEMCRAEADVAMFDLADAMRGDLGIAEMNLSKPSRQDTEEDTTFSWDDAVESRERWTR